MKLFLVICFTFLLASIYTTVASGEENEILGNIENFALRLNSKHSKITDITLDSLRKTSVNHSGFNVSFKPLLGIFKENEDIKNRSSSLTSSAKSK